MLFVPPLKDLFEPRPPARLIVRRCGELDACDAGPGGKIQTLRIEADRPPDLPGRLLVTREACDDGAH